ncbi:MAG: MarR family transcriptional regulator [Rhodobacteraceae bacterium]|nr:MarR family transcriptional regulator [Paracoccaceae bacterium]
MTTENKNDLEFQLQSFFPYLVRDFYAEVTSAVQSAYRQEYNMSPAEWRCMAILGKDQTLSANEIVNLSSMDKVTVSRAVKRMQERAWLVASSNSEDGRSKMLSLTDKGVGTYLEIVPKVLAIEEKLLSNISEEQKNNFLDLIDKVKENRVSNGL